jgi:hypothetical protein
MDMKISCISTLALTFALMAFPLSAQVNSGSDGSDGALNPTSNLVIDMADHPDGIYHYTSVNIPAGVTVSFSQNTGNTPVVWLVQGSVTINGNLQLSGSAAFDSAGGNPGPGGYRGGTGASGVTQASAGLGPGGGIGFGDGAGRAGNASFGSKGSQLGGRPDSGDLYGNTFLIPLIGGSGGGGGRYIGGGGGGGAVMIAASNEITLGGNIYCSGGGVNNQQFCGAGSGGAVRLVSTRLKGSGTIHAGGAGAYGASSTAEWPFSSVSGAGRVRVDTLEYSFSGNIHGVTTNGFQPIIIPPAAQAVALSIESVGGVSVAASPGGKLVTPDVIVPGAQQNPVSIVVRCTNIPLGSEIIVDVKPANGPTIRAVAPNNAGSKASSTATVQVEMPRGGGTIQAKAISGIQLAANDDPNAEHNFIAQAGWTADGERFKAVEVTAGLGASCQLVYLTESGKRYTLNSH